GRDRGLWVQDDVVVVFFFFQAEDGIRDWSVTGVQTCALPISPAQRVGPAGITPHGHDGRARQVASAWAGAGTTGHGPDRRADDRSEERRVGKEGRSRWWRED